jgi:enoyl-CoA hydratase/carnithine racemase
MSKYPDYEGLKLDRPRDRVLRVTLARGKANAMDYRMHHDLTTIWPLIDEDPDISAVILAGQGKLFSAGGEFEVEQRMLDDWRFRAAMWKDARLLVMNLLNFSKPLVSAINGSAAGAGLAAALMADVAIMGRSAKLVDGHTRLGVAAGDHGAWLWPLLCGLAKANYYLLTCDAVSAEEAERIGLVALCGDDALLEEKSLEIAGRLAAGAPTAIRFTKHALRGWLRMAWPIFEASLALEMLGFHGEEPREGLASLMEKRPPRFDPNTPI